MYAFELGRRYREAVSNRDVETVVSLFAPESIVRSPLSGALDVRSFHERLFAVTKYSRSVVQHVFESLCGTNAVAVHLEQSWLLHDDRSFDFECMLLFELASHRTRFRGMTLFYDASLLTGFLDREQLAQFFDLTA